MLGCDLYMGECGTGIARLRTPILNTGDLQLRASIVHQQQVELIVTSGFERAGGESLGQPSCPMAKYKVNGSAHMTATRTHPICWIANICKRDDESADDQVDAPPPPVRDISVCYFLE